METVAAEDDTENAVEEKASRRFWSGLFVEVVEINLVQGLIFRCTRCEHYFHEDKFEVPRHKDKCKGEWW